MLHELHIRNFAIIDDLYLTFGPGLNVLTGETGAGKSIIIDALGLLMGDRASTSWVRAGCERSEIEATFLLVPYDSLDGDESDGKVLDSKLIDSQEASVEGFEIGPSQAALPLTSPPTFATPSPATNNSAKEPNQSDTEDIAQQVQRILEEGGLDDPENRGWVTLSREVRMTGRNICRVNGRSVSVQVLSDIASLLIDVHGQGEHLNLLHPRTHVHLLDRYAGLLPLRRQVAAKVSQLRKIRNELKELNQDARTIAQRLDMLSFQVEEIGQADLVVGEESSLENERRRLGNAEALLALARAAQAILSEGDGPETPSALDLMGEASARVEKLSRIDPEMESVALESQSLLEQVSDLARSLEDYAGQLEFDPHRLQEVEERIELIDTLKRKYGDTIEEVIEFGEAAEVELDELVNWEGKTEALEAQENTLLLEIGTLAADLSSKRQAAGETLAKQVEKELAELGMQKARCGVAVEQNERADGAYHPDGRRVAFDQTGVDRIELMLSTNPGEPLKPMAKVASGGETARIMLAIKSVLAHADATPTLIFDEIDQGIGGRVGAVVGQKLWGLTNHHSTTASLLSNNGTSKNKTGKNGTKKEQGKKSRAKTSKGKDPSKQASSLQALNHQVLCITHLPQLAAFGDQHFTVNKRVHSVDKEERTSTVVSQLEGEERIAELMQMLGATTKAGRESVEEMLAEVEQVKGKR
ncbi:MAG: DNA repair protein RecN [Chloroflexota bacterium]